MDIITSLVNKEIKIVRSLAEKKYRKLYGMYVAEGEIMVGEAIKFKADKIQKIFVQSSYTIKYSRILEGWADKVVLVSEKIMQSMSDAVTPQGILCTITINDDCNEENIGKKPFLVLDRIQDPGNMGTIIRTAVATGYNDIVIIDCVDIYSPKTVRSSSSGIYFINHKTFTEKEFLNFVKQKEIPVIVADMKGENIFSLKPVPPVYGLVIGNEGNGVADNIRKAKSISLALPMKKESESLNAGVSASVLMYILNGKNI